MFENTARFSVGMLCTNPLAGSDNNTLCKKFDIMYKGVVN